MLGLCTLALAFRAPSSFRGVTMAASSNGISAEQSSPMGTPRSSSAHAWRPQQRAGHPSMQLSLDDPRILTVSLARKTGIDFGCDLTLSWPYVLALEDDGAAARSGLVRIGDQLVAMNGQSVLGLPIGEVMERLGSVDGADVALTFFRDTREQLQSVVLAGGDAGPATATVTVRQPDKPEQVFEVPYGANLRDELIARKINVYQSITRWSNCNGKQLCGTCIVNVSEGVERCTRRSLDEASTLRENPDTYKLACITNVYGDVTVEIFPKINPAQWTR
jgi:ferredoxin